MSWFQQSKDMKSRKRPKSATAQPSKRAKCFKYVKRHVRVKRNMCKICMYCENLQCIKSKVPGKNRRGTFETRKQLEQSKNQFSFFLQKIAFKKPHSARDPTDSQSAFSKTENIFKSEGSQFHQTNFFMNKAKKTNEGFFDRPYFC